MSLGWAGVARRRYQGTGLQVVDDKNRVSIPSRLRDILIANSDPETIKDGPYAIMGLHPQFPCLIGYDPEWIDEQFARKAANPDDPIEALDEAGKPIDAFYQLAQDMGGAADHVSFDHTGRCSLIGWQRRDVGIKKHAFFYGAIFYFEIWDPETLLNHPGAHPMAKKACRGIMEDKGLLSGGAA